MYIYIIHTQYIQCSIYNVRQTLGIKQAKSEAESTRCSTLTIRSCVLCSLAYKLFRYILFNVCQSFSAFVLNLWLACNLYPARVQCSSLTCVFVQCTNSDPPYGLDHVTQMTAPGVKVAFHQHIVRVFFVLCLFV